MGIESISREELNSLAETKGSRCVSIYLPAARAGEATLESPKRLKTLVRAARERLERSGVGKREADKLVRPYEELVDDYPFWQHQYGGVGLFATKDFFRVHRTSYAPAEKVVIGKRFHIKPLLPMWADAGRFLLLALSRNAVALYRVTRHDLENIPLQDVPQSQAEALKYDDPEKSLQVHSGQPGSRGGQTAITHGHGAAREQTKERTLRFFQKLDRALRPYLIRENLPLLLAGVDYYLPLYQEANSYAHLIEDVVAGNPEEVLADELRRTAWAKMEPHLRRPRDQAHAKMEEGLSKGQTAADLEQAVAAAWQGRAGTCFVSLGEDRWGSYDESTATVQSLNPEDPEAVDLLDLAAAQTLAQSGEVFPVRDSEDVPGPGPIAVLKRF